MIFEGTTCKAEYIEDKQLVYFDLIGFANVDEYKSMLIKVLNFMKLNKVRAFVHNYKPMKGTFANLNDWIMSEIVPATELGLKGDAMIVNDDIYSSFSIRELILKTENIKLKFFKNRIEAEEWAAEVSKTA